MSEEIVLNREGSGALSLCMANSYSCDDRGGDGKIRRGAGGHRAYSPWRHSDGGADLEFVAAYPRNTESPLIRFIVDMAQAVSTFDGNVRQSQAVRTELP